MCIRDRYSIDKNVTTVLGNHDFNLLAAYFDVNPWSKIPHTMQKLLNDKNIEKMIYDWAIFLHYLDLYQGKFEKMDNLRNHDMNVMPVKDKPKILCIDKFSSM